MQVFKAYFKIINSMKTSLIIYIVIVLGMSVAFSNINTPPEDQFNANKANIAFFTEDTDGIISKGLQAYLSEHAVIIDIAEEEHALQDALFYGKISYIVKVPKDFSQSFLNGEDAVISKTTIPDSAGGFYVDSLINKYLNTAKVYVNSMAEYTPDLLLGYIAEDLSISAEVILHTGYITDRKADACNSYFNFSLYAILSLMILGTGAVMLTFMQPEIKARNLSSPIRIRRLNLLLLSGNVIFALLIFFIFSVTAFLLFPDTLLGRGGILLLANSFIFCMTALSISFLTTNIIKSHSALSAVGNVVGLGSSFLSGAFVPQALLGSKILFAASFTPGYWYIKTNNDIFALSDFSFNALKPIFTGLIIETGFALAILFIALAYAKRKRSIFDRF